MAERILYITDQEALGGDTRAEMLTFRELDRSITITAVYPPACPTADEFDAIPGITRRHVRFTSQSGAARKWHPSSVLAALRAAGAVVAVAVRQRPDAVFVGDRKRPILLGLLAATVTRAALVYHPQFFYLPGDLGGLLRRLIARRAQLVICHSTHSRDTYLAVGVAEQRIVVAPNATDGQHFTPGDGDRVRRELAIANDRFVIGIAGVVRAFKGHDVLIDALARILPRCPEAHVLIVGDGDRREALEEQAKALGLYHHVTFTGWVPDTAPFYPAMDVFAMASIEEPFGLVTIEAMACEVPVVGTASGGTLEIVEDGRSGVLVPPGDADALARAILALYADPGLRQELGRRGRARVLSRFSVRHRAEIVERALLALSP